MWSHYLSIQMQTHLIIGTMCAISLMIPQGGLYVRPLSPSYIPLCSYDTIPQRAFYPMHTLLWSNLCSYLIVWGRHPGSLWWYVYFHRTPWHTGPIMFRGSQSNFIAPFSSWDRSGSISVSSSSKTPHQSSFDPLSQTCALTRRKRPSSLRFDT